MHDRKQAEGLSVDPRLFEFIENEVLPGSGVGPQQFWRGLSGIIKSLAAENRRLLDRRDELQRQIDHWYKARPGPAAIAEQKEFLEETGYLVGEGDHFEITTDNVDEELADIAGPQLVVPVDNARYALNAANARWNSLYDALYGSDIIPEAAGCKRTAKYNPVRGAQVIRYVREFLDHAVPLVIGSHGYAVKYKVKSKNLAVMMGDGSETGLECRECFAGYKGDPEAPTNILFKHNNLHLDVCIGEGYFIGRGDLADIYDVKIESALTTIMDCEDSVAAVDAADKVKVYRNWLGLMKGDLKATLRKEGKLIERALNPDLQYIAPDGSCFELHGRSVMLVRNVGTHMYTDAVTDESGEIPETFLDAMVTAASALHDLRGRGKYRNSRKGSIYIVKPKMHGPEEAAAAVELFDRVEKALGLKTNTLKIGVMDEERRTTVNLKECIRAAKDRIIFINTGFLDRTGDEIHTCMEAGAVIPKNDMKKSSWLLGYEDWNVDVGLACAMPGHGQIGKGMWAAPDNMMAMMEQKIAHPEAGANTAWVPSPTAASLHAMHYHYVNVQARQRQLRQCPRAGLDDLLAIPVLGDRVIDHAELMKELENNAQGILGYVVRWIDHGIGCSKVPDIDNVGLMEDRATLRISSQHISNWLYHGLTTEKQIREVFEKMAVVVDRQNAENPDYTPMADDFENNIAFNTALELVIKGRDSPNGYTEPILHRRRRQLKDLTRNVRSV